MKGLTEQLVICTRHKKAQEKILERDENLTLDEAIDYARTYEATFAHVAQLNKTSETQQSVHTLSKSAKSKQKCQNCETEHEARKCPAYGTTCNSCSKPNHWAKVCRQKINKTPHYQARPGSHNSKEGKQNRYSQGQGRYSNRRIHDLNVNNESSDEFDTLVFDTITVNSITPDSNTQTKDEALVMIDIKLPNNTHNTQLRAKLDTGAQANILPLRLYRSMFPENIDYHGKPKITAVKKSTTTLTAYGGTPIPQFGTCDIECTYNNNSAIAMFYVTDVQSRAIIGLPTALELHLITLNCSVEKSQPLTQETLPTKDKAKLKPDTSIDDKSHLIAQYPNCFDGIGKFQGEYHITLDPSVPPVIHPPQHVPISLKDDIKHELDEMEELDIITKVREGEPTAWVNSLVYRRKPNGRLKICLDPKDLNAAIQRDHHVTPTLEEVLPKLNGATHFSILDARSGYWNVTLDEESSYLTTFNSPVGRYRFKRMPFGLRMSQDVFQSKIDQTFEGCNGVVGIADDIVVFGKTTEEHDENLHGMMERCQNTGLKLNPEKCFIKQKQIKFYGVVCNEDGIKPDPSKVSVLKQMTKPKDRRELQTFLGLATYMGPFIPNLSSITAPLQEILKKNTTLEWNANYQQAFNEVKQAISEQITLNYFDSTKEVILQVDASTKGLGAALIQDGKPVAFASKSLTEVETRYANIEREMLAVVYGCERFHTYLYGRPITVHTDHKPLESIHLKHLTSAPP